VSLQPCPPYKMWTSRCGGYRFVLRTQKLRTADIFSPHGAKAPSSPAPHYRGFTMTSRHTAFGRTPLGEWSARRRDLYLTTHNTHNRQISMPPVGFEPAIPASQRPQTHAFDRAATGMSKNCAYIKPNTAVRKTGYTAYIADGETAASTDKHVTDWHIQLYADVGALTSSMLSNGRKAWNESSINSAINKAAFFSYALRGNHEQTSGGGGGEERHRWTPTCRHWHRCSLVLEDILQALSCGNGDMKKRLWVRHASLTKCTKREAWDRTVLGGSEIPIKEFIYTHTHTHTYSHNSEFVDHLQPKSRSYPCVHDVPNILDAKHINNDTGKTKHMTTN
jgi:hypothetical protein